MSSPALFTIEDIIVPASPGLTISYTFPVALEGHALQAVVLTTTKVATLAGVLTVVNKNGNVVWTVRGNDQAIVPAGAVDWILSYSLVSPGNPAPPLIIEEGGTMPLPWYTIKEGDVLIGSDNSSVPANGSFQSMLIRIL